MARNDKPLNADQSAAVESILTWVANPGKDLFYVLEGSAGTGKTYCMPSLIDEIKGRIVFTAPTNKATKVLRNRLTSDEYKPDTRTTFSLLGLSLSANGEVRELTVPEDPADLSSYRLLVVDEGSMVGGKLQPHIAEASMLYRLPVLYLGDRYQLRPVGELGSPIWQFPQRSVLEKVERYDNAILRLATKTRDALKSPMPKLTFASDNDGAEGVWKYPTEVEFLRKMMEYAEAGLFSKPDQAKAVAWRNARVDQLNAMIRRTIFGPAVALENAWVPGDRVIFTAPAADLEGDKIASTDDEGLVTNIAIDFHPLAPEIKVFVIDITLDDNRRVTARVLHPSSMHAYSEKLDRLALEARANKRFWPKYWDFKELFHNLRHAYAITSHRAQGSTYRQVFVDMNDMLANRDRTESFQSFYVGLTRASHELYIR